MTDRTATKRKAAERQRKAQSGLKRVEVYVPPGKAEDAIRRLAERLRGETKKR